MCKLSAGGKHATVAVTDVAKHCTPHDCWVIVHGSVFNVTDYIPRHPGGAMIYVKAGGDCSQLFDSYHTGPKARCASNHGGMEVAQLVCFDVVCRMCDIAPISYLRVTEGQYWRSTKLVCWTA